MPPSFKTFHQLESSDLFRVLQGSMSRGQGPLALSTLAELLLTLVLWSDHGAAAAELTRLVKFLYLYTLDYVFDAGALSKTLCLLNQTRNQSTNLAKDDHSLTCLFGVVETLAGTRAKLRLVPVLQRLFRLPTGGRVVEPDHDRIEAELVRGYRDAHLRPFLSMRSAVTGFGHALPDLKWQEEWTTSVQGPWPQSGGGSEEFYRLEAESVVDGPTLRLVLLRVVAELSARKRPFVSMRTESVCGIRTEHHVLGWARRLFELPAPPQKELHARQARIQLLWWCVQVAYDRMDQAHRPNTETLVALYTAWTRLQKWKGATSALYHALAGALWEEGAAEQQKEDKAKPVATAIRLMAHAALDAKTFCGQLAASAIHPDPASQIKWCVPQSYFDFEQRAKTAEARLARWDASKRVKRQLKRARYYAFHDEPDLSVEEKQAMADGPFAQPPTVRGRPLIALSAKLQLALKGPFPRHRWKVVKKELQFQDAWHKLMEQHLLFELEVLKNKRRHVSVRRSGPDQLYLATRLVAVVQSPDKWTVASKKSRVLGRDINVVNRASCGTYTGHLIPSWVLGRKDVIRQLLVIWVAKAQTETGHWRVEKMLFECLDKDGEAVFVDDERDKIQTVVVHPLDNGDKWSARADDWPRLLENKGKTELVTRSEGWKQVLQSDWMKRLRQETKGTASFLDLL